MNVYQTLWIMRFLPKFAGAAPYDISKKFIKFSKFGQIWSLFHLLAVSTILYLYRNQIPCDFSNTYHMLNTTLMWFLYFVGIYGVVKDGFCQQPMIDVIRAIDNYDEITGYNDEVRGRRENKQVQFWSFVHGGFLLAFAIGRHLVWGILGLNRTNTIFTMQVENSVIMFVISSFLLGLRVRHLNSMVEQDRTVKVQTLGSETVANPEYVRLLYTRLVTIGHQLNDHYSERLFLWSSLMILALITRFYAMLVINMPATIVAATIVSLLPIISDILFICLACEFVTVQINMTPAVLLKKSVQYSALINRGRKEIFTLSLYMGLQPFEFSALGFFSLDLKFFYTVATLTFTYLTLCLQSNFGGETNLDPPSNSTLTSPNSILTTPNSTLTPTW